VISIIVEPSDKVFRASVHVIDVGFVSSSDIIHFYRKKRHANQHFFSYTIFRAGRHLPSSTAPPHLSQYQTLVRAACVWTTWPGLLNESMTA